MSDLSSELRCKFILIFDEFKSAHALLSEQLLLESDYPSWLQETEKKEIQQKLISTINDWCYLDGEEPGKTHQCHGLIGCSEKTTELIEVVNKSRSALQEILMEMDKVEIKKIVIGDAQIYRTLTKEVLASIGYARLNRRQVCRQIVCLKNDVLAIGFFWNHYRKTEKLKRDDVFKLLDKFKQYNTAALSVIESDYASLREVDDSFFIRVYPESIHRRANITMIDNGNRRRIQRYAHMPIFYLSFSNDKLPIITPLPEKDPEKQRTERRLNITIEDKPYLSSVAIHRVLPLYRNLY